MGATVEELGAVVLEGLRAAGYQESTVGHPTSWHITVSAWRSIVVFQNLWIT